MGESSLLVLESEVGGAEDFFPEIETGLVPVLTDIAQVVGDDGPDYVSGFIELVGFHEGSAIRHQSNCSQCWSVTLRTSPSSIESSSVDLEFGFSQTEAFREERSRWV